MFQLDDGDSRRHDVLHLERVGWDLYNALLWSRFLLNMFLILIGSISRGAFYSAHKYTAFTKAGPLLASSPCGIPLVPVLLTGLAVGLAYEIFHKQREKCIIVWIDGDGNVGMATYDSESDAFEWYRLLTTAKLCTTNNAKKFDVMVQKKLSYAFHRLWSNPLLIREQCGMLLHLRVTV
uniref:AlNc14C119G6610 protein n=1 Tax=Albugo laibachii Nc14 TaxID=890382 RepID=F0WJ78_9STRA|nr:AlNc14C119G6610 [Albugo laibachii Nc14]|eukprot:CCA21325.1 AlNc14C119G6610 [Albugo laibachii Nc14]